MGAGAGVQSARLRAYFDYMKARGDRLWVATFADAAKYARQRMASRVMTKQSGDVIEVAVRHTLDPTLYDLPLTAKTTVPADWKLARVRQGNATTTVPVQREQGETYVIYRVTPTGTAVRLERF